MMVVCLLIRMGADVDREIDGIVPLHYACFIRDMGLVKLMLEYGATATPVGIESPASLLDPELEVEYLRCVTTMPLISATSHVQLFS